MTKVVLHLPESIIRKLDNLPTKRSRARIIKDILAVLCWEDKRPVNYLFGIHRPVFWPLGSDDP